MNRKILLLLVVVTAVYSQCTVNKAGCDICNSATPPKCTDCNGARNFEPWPIPATGGQCLCKPGYQLDGTGDFCINCTLIGCSSCDTETVCQTCDTAGNFVPNGTTCRCADGFYKNSSDECVSCIQFGDTCTKCSSTTCLTCSGDYAIPTGRIDCERKCSIERCVTCFNSTVCSQCVPNSVLSLSQAACTCATTGFFASSTACTACIANCDVCTAVTGCTTCSTGFVFSATTSTCVAFESYMKLVLSLLVIAVLAFAM